jgi:hypothetical protein
MSLEGVSLNKDSGKQANCSIASSGAVFADGSADSSDGDAQDAVALNLAL